MDTFDNYDHSIADCNYTTCIGNFNENSIVSMKWVIIIIEMCKI